MNNVEFDDYLVRGWECGANLFYEGRLYFMQCCVTKDKIYNFYITSFKAEKYNNRSCSPYVYKDGTTVDYRLEFEGNYKSMEEAKQACFSGKFYNGKSFWEIGKKFDWLEVDGPDIVVSENK